MKNWFASQRGMNPAAAGRKLALLVVTPVTSFYLMQLIYGAASLGYPLYAVLGNGLCIGAFYYLFCAATGHLALGSLITHILAGIVGAANYFVAAFRGNPVLPWDFKAIGTALAVSGTYSYRPTWAMIAAALLLAAAAWLIFKKRGLGLFKVRRKWPRAVILAAGLFCIWPIAQPDVLANMGITTDVWDQAKAYRENGIIATFLCNTRFMEVEVPQGYSKAREEELLAQAGRRTGENKEGAGTFKGEKPHIIAIMNESWADFEEFGNLDLNEGVMDFIHSLDGVHGHAYTSVFGAGTSASEFEFLTGNSMAFLPSGSIPYQQYILEPSPSLASLLKEEGYRTLAIHPGERSSWQRDKAYPLLGFEKFICAEDMDVKITENHGYISDESSFAQVIREFEKREPGERMFIFNVTIQNHGSYTDETFPASIRLIDEPGEYPKAEQYLSLVKETDKAFQGLIEYFESQEEPVVIVMFGDHQPAVEQEFLDKAYGVKQEDMSMAEYMDKFRVPFVIWSNKGLEGREPEITSLNFLAQYVLRYAGIRPDAYGNYLQSFMTQIPALTFAGYVDAQGEAHSHLETNGYRGVIEEYQTVQYGRLFGE